MASSGLYDENIWAAEHEYRLAQRIPRLSVASGDWMNGVSEPAALRDGDAGK